MLTWAGVLRTSYLCGKVKTRYVIHKIINKIIVLIKIPKPVFLKFCLCGGVITCYIILFPVLFWYKDDLNLNFEFWPPEEVISEMSWDSIPCIRCAGLIQTRVWKKTVAIEEDEILL